VIFIIVSINGTKYWVFRDLHRIDHAVGVVTRLAEEKLTATRLDEIDAFMLGDSSLGYGIDQELFSEITNLRTLSLPLTGGHGLPGALLQLRNLVGGIEENANIIFFFSVDALAWGENPAGRFYMSALPFEPALSVHGQIRLLIEYVRRLIDLKEASRFIWDTIRGVDNSRITDQVRSHGYIASPGKIDLDAPHLKNYSIPEKIGSTAYINEIGRVCSRYSLNCLYVFGPLMRAVMRDPAKEQRFYDSSKKVVESSGIRMVLDAPLPIDDAFRGDTPFHVSPAFRRQFTEKYARLLVPYLRD
tara:strand:- start:4305 stop:5210 length:906 start_codon:yes stop_codon:yes gene_type:complete